MKHEKTTAHARNRPPQASSCLRPAACHQFSNILHPGTSRHPVYATEAHFPVDLAVQPQTPLYCLDPSCPVPDRSAAPDHCCSGALPVPGRAPGTGRTTTSTAPHPRVRLLVARSYPSWPCCPMSSAAACPPGSPAGTRRPARGISCQR